MLPVIVDAYSMLPPAICFKCRAGAQAPRLYWVYMQVNQDFEGACYYCNECLYDVVEAMPDAFRENHVEKLISTYQLEIDEARELHETAARVVERLRFLGFDVEKLLTGGPVGRMDRDSNATESVSDEHYSGKQLSFDADEQETDGSVSSGKFSFPRFG